METPCGDLRIHDCPFLYPGGLNLFQAGFLLRPIALAWPAAVRQRYFARDNKDSFAAFSGKREVFSSGVSQNEGLRVHTLQRVKSGF